VGDFAGHPFRGNQYVSAARGEAGGFHDPLRDPAPAREPGFVYHATNEDNIEGIADKGLLPHGPSFGTDQDSWPDGSTAKRSYFIDDPAHAGSFAPSEGRPVLVRVPEAGMKRESTTRDRFTNKKLSASLVEVLGKNGKWYRLGKSDYEKNPARDATRSR